jgi:hypothetical protein
MADIEQNTQKISDCTVQLVLQWLTSVCNKWTSWPMELWLTQCCISCTGFLACNEMCQ